MGEQEDIWEKVIKNYREIQDLPNWLHKLDRLPYLERALRLYLERREILFALGERGYNPPADFIWSNYDCIHDLKVTNKKIDEFERRISVLKEQRARGA
jgi:hypothetical protein